MNQKEIDKIADEVTEDYVQGLIGMTVVTIKQHRKDFKSGFLAGIDSKLNKNLTELNMLDALVYELKMVLNLIDSNNTIHHTSINMRLTHLRSKRKQLIKELHGR